MGSAFPPTSVQIPPTSGYSDRLTREPHRALRTQRKAPTWKKGTEEKQQQNLILFIAGEPKLPVSNHSYDIYPPLAGAAAIYTFLLCGVCVMLSGG